MFKSRQIVVADEGRLQTNTNHIWKTGHLKQKSVLHQYNSRGERIQPFPRQDGSGVSLSHTLCQYHFDFQSLSPAVTWGGLRRGYFTQNDFCFEQSWLICSVGPWKLIWLCALDHTIERQQKGCDLYFFTHLWPLLFYSLTFLLFLFKFESVKIVKVWSDSRRLQLARTGSHSGRWSRVVCCRRKSQKKPTQRLPRTRLSGIEQPSEALRVTPAGVHFRILSSIIRQFFDAFINIHTSMFWKITAHLQ